MGVWKNIRLLIIGVIALPKLPIEHAHRDLELGPKRKKGVDSLTFMSMKTLSCQMPSAAVPPRSILDEQWIYHAGEPDAHEHQRDPQVDEPLAQRGDVDAHARAETRPAT